MAFTSIEFVCFFSIVFIAFWLLPQRYKNIMLLFVSYAFYASWGIKYVTVLAFVTICSFWMAKRIQNEKNDKRRKSILAIAVVSVLLPLSFYKYADFFIESISPLLRMLIKKENVKAFGIIVPVGISFYTFQSLGYLIDVYRKKVKADNGLVDYALFVSFFPQILSGPIGRYPGLITQIKSDKEFNYQKITYGFKLIAWGLFKKLCIADNLALYVSGVWGNLSGSSSRALLVASIFYSIQIYCDFSGYSDIAIGISKMMCIDLLDNFKSPYLSTSVKEFWSRWHISLSTWFRDYVYIPLGGNRCNKIRHYFNLLMTFLLSGLWHGANWTFLAWGGFMALPKSWRLKIENGLAGYKNPFS